MAIRIGVFGNCDTGGMSYALRAMLPGHQIKALTPPGPAAERDAWFADLSNQHDILLVNNTVFKGGARIALEPSLERIRRYPTSRFAAFHPDCCYVWVKSRGGPIFPAYNSAICLAGFVRGLSQAQVIELFTGEVFEKVGYFDAWNSSVKHMQEEFADCGMDHRPFHLKVKRLGAFMHSMNHPKIEAIVTMARFVALQLGAKAEVLERPVTMPDSLAGLDWPLYPEIGEIYGVRGGYTWKIDGELLDLERFVAYSFARYTELKLKIGDVSFHDDSFHEQFAAILNERGIGSG